MMKTKIQVQGKKLKRGTTTKILLMVIRRTTSLMVGIWGEKPKPTYLFGYSSVLCNHSKIIFPTSVIICVVIVLTLLRFMNKKKKTFATTRLPEAPQSQKIKYFFVTQMEDSDWEKAYEAERRAGAASSANARRRGPAQNEDELFAAYYGGAQAAASAQKQQPAQVPESSANKSNAELFGEPNPFSSSSAPSSKAVASTSNSASPPPGALVSSFSFSTSTATPTTPASVAPGGYPSDESTSDPRWFNLPFEQVPEKHRALFRDRISPFCFFAHDCYHYTKAFIGTSKHNGLAVVTSHGITVFDVESGAAVGGIAIGNLATLYVVGPGGIGMRSKAKTDYFIKFDTRRERFVEIVKQLYTRVAVPPPPADSVESQYFARGGGGGGDDGPKLNTIEGSDEKEKAYRGEMSSNDQFVKAGNFNWVLGDDVRSGLELIFVPNEHRVAYAPLCVPSAPKLLHHFGGVNQLTLTPGAGKKAPPMYGPQRRGCWITPSALFMSLPQGPGDFGQGIRRAVYIEFLRSVIVSAVPSSTQMGLVIGGGSPQPDVLLEFDSPAIRNKVLFVIRRVFTARTHQPCHVRTINDTNIKDQLRIADDSALKPVFQPMFTIPELLAHLRVPLKKA